MAFFCITMLDIALELALENPVYENVASKFFENFVAILDTMNKLGGERLWDKEDGFYYGHLVSDDGIEPLKVRSMVGLIPLYACLVLEDRVVQQWSGFRKRLDWFLKNRKDLANQV